uniref:hypothetical protein n=1 Tax=Aquincola tertiaricarbonis TaxID=391953 RepID=UPI0035C05E94
MATSAPGNLSDAVTLRSQQGNVLALGEAEESIGRHVKADIGHPATLPEQSRADGR